MLSATKNFGTLSTNMFINIFCNITILADFTHNFDIQSKLKQIVIRFWKENVIHYSHNKYKYNIFIYSR